ncbi:alanine racemase domain protein [Pseudogulbenkiania sp. NH8B]|uniref:alanine racemase n=1 Tax=Pseudogulbenkiania sp. (strain NH8B) TaxID=748280 RepID=UPI0002279C72|nr:alanine racemase [Pseudogulbenkiania sp. NH8B]BAK75936.1 alanine racemase domain protein [Pseudogulbenkiania sp. NH8B]
MAGPRIIIDLDRIEENTSVLVEACRTQGIQVAGVTKSACGSPRVARAMVRGGVAQITDSRLDNIMRLRRDGIAVPLMLIRAPAPGEAEQVVRHADISLNSELQTLQALSRAALQLDVVHDVVLMIDLGDLREGILPHETMDYVEQILALAGVRLIGIGANLACVGGIQPTVDNLSNLAYLADEIRRRHAIELPIVSGGNTFSLPLLEQGQLPAGINHLRLGASIMLAESPTPPGMYEKLHKDAYTLTADVIEAKTKPSRPYGLSGEDAFGRRPVFDGEDRPARRLILAMGREDIAPEGLRPSDERLQVLGASSDHLIVDASAAEATYRLGDSVAFTLDYGALLMAMTSPYVAKEYRLRRAEAAKATVIKLFNLVEKLTDACEPLASHLLLNGLREELEPIGHECVEHGKKSADSFFWKAPVDNDDLYGLFYRSFRQIPLILSGGTWHDTPIPVGHVAGQDTGAIVFTSRGNIDRLLTLKKQKRGPSLENTVLIGVRHTSLEDKALLDDYGVRLITIDEIDRHGLASLMPKTIAAVGQGVVGLHVHFDIDVMDGRDLGRDDPTHLGGLTYREAHFAMELIHESGLLQTVSLGGLSAEADAGGRLARFVNGLLASLLGRKVVKKIGTATV